MHKSARWASGLAFATAFALLATAAPASPGSEAHPEVTDDPNDDAGIAPDLNIESGWVGAETATSFSIFMKIESLAAPTNPSEFYQYHFHFQVLRTDGNTSLYHAMVHHHADGTWMWMVQRWISTGGVGAWGESHDTDGVVTGGLIEAHVQKAWIDAPRIDMATNTWTISSFYIHADRVNEVTGAIVSSDTAPTSGTMGSYAVSVGAPATPSGSAGPILLVGLVVVAVVTLLLVRGSPGRTGGRR